MKITADQMLLMAYVDWTWSLWIHVCVCLTVRLSGGGVDQPATNRPTPPSTNSQTSTPSRPRDVSSTPSSRSPGAAAVDAGGRPGSQANGYQSLVSASPAAASDWASSRNRDSWNSSRVRCSIIITAAVTICGNRLRHKLVSWIDVL